MFFNTRNNDQDRTSATYAAIQKVLAPLQQVAPELHAEFITACERQYSPSRLGEILRMHLTAMQEQADQEYSGREGRLRLIYEDELQKLKTLSKAQENEIRELKNNMVRMQMARDEAIRKLASQNSLIASLHQQIQNLNGGSAADK